MTARDARKPAGLVLCGGGSRRMGQSKAWLPFGPEKMLQRVVRLVGEAADPIVVAASPEQSLPPLPPNILIARDLASDQGPLQGLRAGFAALPPEAGLVSFTATDVPFLTPAWIVRLCDLIGTHDLAVPSSGGRLHPLSALYRRDAALPVLESMLGAGRLRLTEIANHLRTRIVEAGELAEIDPALNSLRNLNTPEDYRNALQMLEGI